MANEIKAKYGSSTAAVITMAGMANGLARQSDMVDNSSNRFQMMEVAVNTKLGTSPVEGSLDVYLIRSSGPGGTPIRTDSAGASDATITILNAELIKSIYTGDSPSTGDVLKDVMLIENPGEEWGIAILNDTGVNLDNTGGNHVVSYKGSNPEVQ